MSLKLEIQPNGIQVLRVSGTLTWDAFEQLHEMHPPEESGEKVNLLVLLEDFEGWDNAAEWGELRYVERNDAALRRVAVVGDEQWQDRMEMFMLKGVRPVEIRYFPTGEADLARLWLEAE